MDNFKGLIKNYKYLVLGNDSTCNCYRSLRDISTEIVVDYTTISKKLKENGGGWCLCTSKESKSHFYIKKIKIDSENDDTSNVS